MTQAGSICTSQINSGCVTTRVDERVWAGRGEGVTGSALTGFSALTVSMSAHLLVRGGHLSRGRSISCLQGTKVGQSVFLALALS